MKRIAILMLSSALGGCLDMPTQQQVSEADYGDPIAQQEEAEAQAKEAMQYVLKDAASAIYKCQLGGKGWMGSGKAWGGYNVYGWLLVCDINAKNSFGAYAGFERYGFIFHDGRLKRAALFSDMAMQIVYDSP